MEKQAKVMAIELDKYILKVEGSSDILNAKLRGSVKRNNSVLVGDNVLFEVIQDDVMITSVMPRKNSLIRPPAANIEQMIIVISISSPKPDYLLLDKQIILCKSKNIKPIICVNKVDLAVNEELEKEINYIKEVYNLDTIFVSALDSTGIDEIKNILKGKCSVFSGNSGVGKSSITQKIMNIDNIEIGEIGEKSNRGKHTTKAVTLYEIDKDTVLLDTPGFSSYELYDIEYKKLRDHYDEFLKLKCDYEDCMHITEGVDVCAVKKKVAFGEIDKDRYDRYVYLYQRLKELDDKKYKK